MVNHRRSCYSGSMRRNRKKALEWISASRRRLARLLTATQEMIMYALMFALAIAWVGLTLLTGFRAQRRVPVTLRIGGAPPVGDGHG